VTLVQCSPRLKGREAVKKSSVFVSNSSKTDRMWKVMKKVVIEDLTELIC
jgi:hypothetical protein